MQVPVSPLAATVLGALSPTFKPITTLILEPKIMSKIMDRNLLWAMVIKKTKTGISSSICDECSCSNDKMSIWGKGKARNKVSLKFPGFGSLTPRKIQAEA